MGLEKKLYKATKYISKKIGDFTPEVGLILGSGLGFFADQMSNSKKLSYNDIPGFVYSTVVGHDGKLVFGTIGNKKCVAMQGRFHFYEGYKMKKVTFPVRLMKRLGVKTLIVTNAAGGVNTAFKPGDLMIIKDHINFMGTNPCIGKQPEDAKERFFDMGNAYEEEYRTLAKNISKELNIDIKEGTYFAVTGPSYETPAEIKMIRTLGGDAVGMSTVPEVIVAKEIGIKVCGISCITNMAAGVSETQLNHDEVTETAKKVRNIFIKLIDNIIKKI